MATSNVPRRSAPYTPFTTPALSREVEEFRNRARQLWEEPLPRWMREGMSPSVSHVVDWYPAAEVSEAAAEFTVVMELAGMKSKDVHVDFNDGVLTVRGEKSSERETKDEGRKYHVWERSYGSFQRSFAFPSGVDPERIKAGFRDGVLTVHIPKREEAVTNGRKITVKDG